MRIKEFLLLAFLSLGFVNGQATRSQVESILGPQLQSPEIPSFQLRHYLLKRVAKLSVPASPDKWAAETKRLRKHLLEIVFHGWPKEWVNSPPRFQDLGPIETGTGYQMRKLRYEIVPGFLSTAILYEPEKLVGKVPAILNVNGHVGNPGKSVEYKQKRCINYAQNGILALNLEWLSYGELSHEENRHSFGGHLDLVGVNSLGLFYLAMRRGLDYLYEHQQVDRTRLGVTGLSGGGWQTIVLSSLDERVTVAVPVAGYGSLASRLKIAIVNDIGDNEQIPTDFLENVDYSHLTALRAPRPTLLIYNAEDDCCFRAPVVKEGIFDNVKPFFRLFAREDALAWHENTDPSTHNYFLDNRLQSYRFFSRHFNLSIIEHEIPVGAEIKSYEELVVGLPEDNLTILGLARQFGRKIKRESQPKDTSANSFRITSKRSQLKKVVRYQPQAVEQVWPVANKKDKGLESLSYRFELDNGLSATGVWLKAIESSDDTPITIVLHDQGKKAASHEVAERVNRGEQVLALDLLLTGDATPLAPSPLAPAPWQFAQMLAAVGERPLGIEVAQLIALATWLRTRSAAPRIRLESIGIRNQVVSTIAAALEPKLFFEIVNHEGMRSFEYLLEVPVPYREAADLFCLDLYKEFDLDQLIALAEPTKVTHRKSVEAISK